MKLVADITTEELEKLEREFRSGTSSVKSIKEFVSPQDLYQELIASIKKYHPSADISLVEKAYKVADTPLDRMIIEYDELKQKIDKLDMFLDSEKFKTLDEKVKGLLSSQYHIMIAYSIVLSERMRLM